MDDYIKKLYENVITSTKNSKEAIDILKNIKGKILSVGTGGSKVVSDYLSQVLGYKNECIVKNDDKLKFKAAKIIIWVVVLNP